MKSFKPLLEREMKTPPDVGDCFPNESFFWKCDVLICLKKYKKARMITPFYRCECNICKEEFFLLLIY